MKTLLFSDSHLTNKFDSELFDYISKLVKSADQVVINGDFWDAYLTSFDAFCNSEWKKLFPLLKKKNTVYVVGNHDKLEFMDERCNVFSNLQVEDYEFKSGKKEFYVTHGHLIMPAYDNMFFFRNPLFVRYFYKIMNYFAYQVIGFKQLYAFFENKKNIEQFLGLKKFSKEKNVKGQFFIFGHSHVPNLNINDNFISLGEFQKKKRSYCMIDDGEIEFVVQKF